jgi:hypothetical protein
MCTCITFCWIRQLSRTTLTGPVTFGVRELCLFVLHSAGTDNYLTLLILVPWHMEDESYMYLYYIVLDQRVINTTRVGSVAFGGRELYVLALHSAGPHLYLTLL